VSFYTVWCGLYLLPAIEVMGKSWLVWIWYILYFYRVYFFFNWVRLVRLSVLPKTNPIALIGSSSRPAYHLYQLMLDYWVELGQFNMCPVRIPPLCVGVDSIICLDNFLMLMFIYSRFWMWLHEHFQILCLSFYVCLDHLSGHFMVCFQAAKLLVWGFSYYAPLLLFSLIMCISLFI